MSEKSSQFVAAKSNKTLAIPDKAYQQIFESGIDVIVHGHLHESYQRAINVNNHRGEIFCFGWQNGKRNYIHFEG